ncbi:Retrovirus-related Pol polyprotein from transposon TNT 1-94 [Vitis vinifera]|uniref:Retrovirus-related Pol polyprotein from transposon TNT 1-94 n=1 Tax=Vitis vinifera TaxID=29760 RepID=A0A438ECH4_VITVI|nr:Retrovirus-related Pol polyprotein from transposon TNT 1-94 [Vitis vinifera]
MTHLDPRTNQCELEVQRIIHLQNLANQLPDAFIDTKKVTKSHISANTPARIDVPVGQLTNESKIRLKRGRPVGSKDVTPRKRRTQEKLGTLEEAIKMTDQFKIDKSIALEEAQIMQKAPKRHILNKKPPKRHILNKKPLKGIVASEVIRNDEDPEPRNVEECRHRNDWPKWKEAIQAELNSLTKREVFGPVVQTPEDVKPVGNLDMWYNRLSEYLLKEGYVNNPICPCIFIKKSETGFAIIAVYVDDLNLVGTPEELTRTTNYLKKEFEMKDLGKTKFCLGLQIEHFPNGVLVHQSTYIKKVLKRFYMDKAHPLSSPMVVRSLDVKKTISSLRKDEELLGPEVPYLSAIGALMYLANCTRPDIAFSVNLLARYSSAPTRRHWNDAGYLSDPHKGRSQTGGYIKGDRTKHISPKFFYTHELQKSGEIDVQQIRSSDNLADLFTKSLPTSTFKKLIHRLECVNSRIST